MKRLFAALRFVNDENLSDKVYWYLCDLSVKEGDRVLAPVGIHDRLQEGIVEKLLNVGRENAPYDLRLIKRVTARLGERKLFADGILCAELGGVKYDRKHYTRFFVALYAESAPGTDGQLRAYGVTKIFPDTGSAAEIYEELVKTRGCVLLTGKCGAEVFRGLLALAHGDENAVRSSGADRETVRRLQEKIL